MKIESEVKLQLMPIEGGTTLPTWDSVVAALEHDVGELSQEECALNLRQPEFLYGRVSKLERAWAARSQGVPVADWCVQERDATRLRLRLELESAERLGE